MEAAADPFLERLTAVLAAVAGVVAVALGGSRATGAAQVLFALNRRYLTRRARSPQPQGSRSLSPI